MEKKEPGYYYQKNKEYSKKWNAKFVECKLRVPAETREAWKAAAAAAGESLNTFITTAVEARIKDMEG